MIHWSIRVFLYGLMFAMIAFMIFAFDTARAQAAIIVSPSFIPDYASTAITTTCDDAGHDQVSFFADTGASDNAANDCNQSGTWSSVFSSSNHSTGTHVVIEVLGYPSWTSGCDSTNTLTECRESAAYVNETEVCLTDEGECGEPTPPTPTTTPTTSNNGDIPFLLASILLILSFMAGTITFSSIYKK